MIQPALRLRELVLLPVVLTAGLLGFATLALVLNGRLVPADLHSLLVCGLAVACLHIILSLVAPNSDQLVLPLSAMLSTIGLIAAQRFAAEPMLGIVGRALPGRQTAWLLIGVAVTAGVVAVPGLMRALQRYRYVWLISGLLLVFAALLIGSDVTGSGARLWLGIGQWQFQPSEVLKVLMVAFLASYLDERREMLSGATLRVGPLRLPPPAYLLPLLLMWGLSMAVLVMQEDLGAAVLFFAIFLAMLYMATGQKTYIGLGLILFVLGALAAFALFPHVRVRAEVWLNPWADTVGRGYQTVQALLALASGGLLGVGLGYGYPGYIPAVHTDMPLAALGEEIGAAGLLAIVALYTLLVVRGVHIAMRAADGFQALLAAGLSVALGVQTLLILGGTLRVLPLTGITLPFISYGGSSLLTNFLIVGLLLRVSMNRQS
jgi:cell division protein FtsW (lipid II flippase)